MITVLAMEPIRTTAVWVEDLTTIKLAKLSPSTKELEGRTKISGELTKETAIKGLVMTSANMFSNIMTALSKISGEEFLRARVVSTKQLIIKPPVSFRFTILLKLDFAITATLFLTFSGFARSTLVLISD